MGYDIHACCREGLLDRVKQYINKGRDPNCKDCHGCTLLHNACLSHNHKLVLYLCEVVNNSTSSKDDKGNTPLHLACLTGDYQIVMYLIDDRKCKTNTKNNKGNVPLQSACYQGHLDVVQYMIKTGCCDTTIRGFEGESLLHAACRSSNLELVQYLVNQERFDIHQRTEDDQRSTALHVASEFSNLAVVQWLVHQGLNPEERDENGVTPLHVVYGTNILKYFLEPESSDLKCNPNICTSTGETPLHFAIRYNKIEVVKYLINEKKCDPLHSDNDGCTCPHLAAAHGALRVLRFLNELGFDTNSKNKQGDTALCLACRNGHLEVVKYIIKIGCCDTSIRGFSGESLLHAACRSSNLELVQYLVNEVRLDIHQRTEHEFRRTALHVASQFSSIPLVQWLVQQGLNPEERDENGDTPLHLVSDVNILKYFLEPEPSGLNCNPNICTSTGETLLHFAVRYNDIGVVKYLINEKKCDPLHSRNDGCTYLHLAAANGAMRVLIFLNKLGCDMNSKNKHGDTALCLACRNGHLEVVKYMIKTGHCDTTIRAFSGESLLHAACRSSNLELVQYLVNEERFDVHGRTEDKRRRTGLHVASESSSIGVVQWLVQQGLNPEEIDETGVTPLHLVSDMNILKYFVQPEISGLNCNPNIYSISGQTPLHFAVHYNKIEVVKYLINEKKCDPLNSDNDGCTCLHLAAANGALRVLRFLNELGFDANSKNKQGDTALCLACRNGHLEVVKYIIKTGCCDTTVSGFSGESLLHAACRSSNLELVKYLVNEVRLDIHQRTGHEFRRTALHVASQFSSIAVVQWLVQQGLNPEERDENGVTPLHVVYDMNIMKYFLEPEPSGLNCNPNVCTSTGETLLHFTVCCNEIEVVKYLINEKKCDPLHSRNDGCTYLHLAAANGAMRVLIFLNKLGCDMNSKNKHADTALCLACRNGHLEVVKYMIKTGHCDTTIRWFQGESLLHAACRSSNLELVQYLVNEERFDIHQRTGDEWRSTALHVASEFSSIAIVQWLVQQGLNPEERDESGVTPLYLVSDMNVLKYFLEPEPSGLNCNPNICSGTGQTPLHFAVRYNEIEVVKYLINEKKCDPMHVDNNGNTCPHLAAMNGALTILEFLHQLGCDLNRKNGKEWSPLHCALKANRSSIVKFLLDVCKCELEFSKHSYSSLSSVSDDCASCILQSMFLKNHAKRKFVELLRRVPSYISQKVDVTVKLAVLGDSRAGKSTLVRALTEEVKWNILYTFRSERDKIVRGVEEYTAGIVTHEFESKHFGHVLIFDFAGHEEYHASHSKVMAKFLLQDTIILLVVDVSLSDHDVELSLKRWLNFVSTLGSRAGTHSHVLVIASHFDQLRNKGLRSAKRKLVNALLDRISSVNEHVTITNIFELDCRKLVSNVLDMMRKELQHVCNKLRSEVNIDFRCLQIMDHISKKYSDCQCCTVGDLFESLQWNELECEDIIPLLECLHKKGVLILSDRKSSRVEECVFILNYSDLLSTVNGSIFAPDTFHKSFKGLSTNTGIVTFDKLRNAFPTIADVNAVIVFLEHFQFCKELTLHSLLNFIKVPESYSAEQRFFFFPSLVTQARKDIVCEVTAMEQSKGNGESSFWLLKSAKDSEFPANFLHHIILCLVLTYLKDPKESDLVDEAPVIQKICKLWNTGICWSDNDGRVLVETVEKKALVVLVSCVEGRKVEMMRLHSRLVQDILMIKDETCGSMSVSECLVPIQLIPSYQPTLRLIQSLESYSMEEIRDCVKNFGSLVVNSHLQSRPLPDVVTADPFCMLSSQPVEMNVLKLMLDNLEKQIDCDHVVKLGNSFSDLIDLTLLRRILRVDRMSQEIQFQQVVDAWILHGGARATFRDLFKELSCYSIFCGRNPLTLEWVCHPSESRLDSHQETVAISHQTSCLWSGDELDSSHVAVVMEWLDSLTEYMRLGLELGLSYPLLNKIRHEQGKKVEDCKRSLLHLWLARADRVDQMGGANKQALAAALRRMGNHRHADSIIPGSVPLRVRVSDALPDGALDPSDDLVTVLRELDALRDWKSLGLQLGLHICTLNEIEDDEQSSSHRKMAMLYSWLSLRDSVKDQGGATRNALVTALHKVDENVLGHRIESKGLRPSHSPTLSCELDTINMLLYIYRNAVSMLV